MRPPGRREQGRLPPCDQLMNASALTTDVGVQDLGLELFCPEVHDVANPSLAKLIAAGSMSPKRHLRRHV